MKYILLLSFLLSFCGFSQDFYRSQTTKINVLYGQSFEKSNGEKSTEDASFLGLSFRVGKNLSLGAFYNIHNYHYGWQLGIDLKDYLRMRVLVGQAKKTDFEPTGNPLILDDDRNYSFGLGYNWHFTKHYGLSIQAISYDGGTGSINTEVTSGLLISF